MLPMSGLNKACGRMNQVLPPRSLRDKIGGEHGLLGRDEFSHSPSNVAGTEARLEQERCARRDTVPRQGRGGERARGG
jgi:hypothetical protein